MKCQDIRQELTALLGQELSQGKEAAVKQHIMNCSSCAREYLRLQMAEQRLREGLHADADDDFAKPGQLGNWVTKEAAKLSAQDIEEKTEWVSGLFNADLVTEPDLMPKRSGSRSSLKAFVSVALLVMVLFLYWPQVIRVSAQMPYVGDWVRQLVLKDAGLTWAYENGYMSESRVIAEKDGVRLTVLGTVADHIQTTVIYLIEGLNNQGAVSIDAINGNQVGSWQSPPIDTHLGKVGMIHTNPLPNGRHFLTIRVRIESTTIASGPELNVEVSREAISRLSQEFPLDYRKTADGVTVEARRVVYTPTQVLVEYTISGGSPIEGPFSEYAIYLVDTEGNRLVSSFSTGSEISGSQWYCQVVFNRPDDIRNLQMVIPTLGRYEEVNLVFTPEDVGKLNILDPDLTLVSWAKSQYPPSEQLELQVEFGGSVRGLRGWTLTSADSDTYDVKVMGMGWNKYSTIYGFNATYSESIKLTAAYAQYIVRGNWQIPLPEGE